MKARGKIHHLDVKMAEGKIKISPSRLILGGPAIFKTEKRNHHIDIIGTNINIPLEMKSLRVPVFS